MTYNIAYLSVSDLATVAALIKSLNAHVVCLNEVDFNADRSGNVDQTELLAGECGYPHSIYAPAFEFVTGSTGNAILSRVPIISSSFLPLTYVEDFQRVALIAVIKTPGGETTVVSTHLNGGPLRDEERILHLNEINAAIGSGPCIVCGDFNAIPTSDTFTHAAAIWTHWGPNVSELSTALDRRDYGFGKGVTATGAQIVDSSASDHKPLATEIL
jgi:endonuclease/exonuclease/phosphatase family metal-dependent hydrolase